MSSLQIVRVDQIGVGPGVRIETLSAPILVQGICRLGGGPRLYTSLGTPLEVQAMTVKEGIRINVALAELGIADMALYDLRGICLWRSSSTPAEERDRFFERLLPLDTMSGLGIFTVTTPTQRVSKLLLEGLR